MNPKLKTWFLRGSVAGLVLLGGLALTAYLTRDFWFRQLRIYVLGQIETQALETGWEMPFADQIEVIALGGRNPEENAFTFMPGRPSQFIVAGRKTLDAKASGEVFNHWRSLDRSRRGYALCHQPGYALRFFSHGRLLLETTVCWECHNYSVPVGTLGFEDRGFIGFADDKDSKGLLALLQAHVPLPDKTGVALNPGKP